MARNPRVTRELLAEQVANTTGTIVHSKTIERVLYSAQYASRIQRKKPLISKKLAFPSLPNDILTRTKSFGIRYYLLMKPK